MCGVTRAWAETYCWVGGKSNNWSDAENWKYDSTTGTTANEAPGDKPDANVSINDNGATITLDVSTKNALGSIEILSGNLNLKANLSATSITANPTCTLDFANFNVSADFLWASGTISLYGDQDIKCLYIYVEEVKFYGDTGTTHIKVSKMATDGNKISTLRCDLSNSTDRKVLDFTGINRIGTLTLTGNTTKLGITATSPTTINITTKVDKASNLRVNYNNVNLTGQSCDVSDGTSFDINGDNQYGLLNGWKFPDSNVYYWVGGNANWDNAGNWRYFSPNSGIATEYPGAKPNAEVHIEPTAAETVTLNVSSLANPIKDITINSNGTLTVPSSNTLTINSFTNNGGTINLSGTLTANGTWNNTGTVNVNDTNATFSSGAVNENGTWTYNNTTNQNLVNIAYNNLVLAGTNTITLTAAVTANNININGSTTLALGANDLTVRNSWSNSGTVTITSGNANLPAGTIDNGTWTYTVLRTGLVPITYNVLNLHGGTAGTIITPTATVTANSVNINAGTILALGANNLSVQNTWTNDGTVTVTSGNATFATPATDSGTWTYNNTSSRSLINLTYNDLNLDGTNTNTITPIADVSATGTITISGATTFDLASRDISTDTIENKGTIKLLGTQSVVTVNVKNDPATSTVEFYGNTGTTPIDVSKMGTSYGNFTVSGYNKTLEFTGTTTVAGDLILKGSNDNAPLTIASSGGAIINVAKSQGTTSEARGIYLAIDRKNVTFTGMRIDNINGNDYFYWADNSYDTDNTLPAALGAVRNGWRIPTIELTNMQLSVAPLGGNTVYVRAVQNTMDNLAKVSPRILSRLPLFFNVADTGATQMATVSSANLIYNGGKVAWIRLVLSGLGNITVDNLKNYYVGTYTTDPNNGNMTREYHPLSDFAVGAVNPLFAYDNRYADSDANWQTSAFSSGVAVRNWDAGQGNDGSLLSKKDIVMSARLAGGSGNDMGNPVLYLSNNPTSGSQSNKYNGDTNSSWRVWLPVVTGVGELAGTPNGNAINNAITVSGSGTNPIFNIPAGSNSSYGNWKDGDQITFMFGVTDTANAPINVGGATIGGQTVQSHPLYALRLREPGDITSLDLWSVRLRGMTAHRGGVSIRNNVINVTTGEQVTIEVDMPTTGTLNVMVMTLDGSIVKYLQHGTASEGKHAYHWGGLTNSGSPVARGLYFVRVVGSGIDETRKVMVVK